MPTFYRRSIVLRHELAAVQTSKGTTEKHMIWRKYAADTEEGWFCLNDRYRWRCDNKRGTTVARREISVPGSSESAAMMDFFHFLNAAKERAEFRD